MYTCTQRELSFGMFYKLNKPFKVYDYLRLPLESLTDSCVFQSWLLVLPPAPKLLHWSVKSGNQSLQFLLLSFFPLPRLLHFLFFLLSFNFPKSWTLKNAKPLLIPILATLANLNCKVKSVLEDEMDLLFPVLLRELREWQMGDQHTRAVCIN